MIVKDLSKLELVLLLLVVLLVRSGYCLLRCRCTTTTNCVDGSMECRGVCEARRRNGTVDVILDCHDPVFGPAPTCNVTHLDPVRYCCTGYDFCNEDLVDLFLPVTTPTVATTKSSGTTPTAGVFLGGTKDPLFRQITIGVPVASAIIVVLILVGTPLLICLLRYRKTHIEQFRTSAATASDLERSKVNGDSSPPPMYSPYSLDTLDLDATCTSGSGSGEPLLSQRTVARTIKVGESIGSGRFGQVFVGEFQGDLVAIKKFASRDEKSWFRESEVYNTVLLRHDNILGFFACDVYSNNGITELWLITQYHSNGSLYDYLNLNTVTPKIMMRMVISICKGLTHLHTEFTGTSAKPAIAHRDMKSKNVLVKNSLECCIADFGLAVIKGPSSNINFPTNPKQGTKRYMAPEVLSETINMNNFECFKQVDVYAFGLIVWEVCKRCGGKNDSVGEYEPPFHGMVGPDPSFEEMKKVVVIENRRPAIPAQWKSDDLFSGLFEVMKECWYANGSARNETLYFKMKLFRLAKEDKIEYEVQE